MQKTTVNGKIGVFIPIVEFRKGKFFNEVELQKLQKMVLSQREAIENLEKRLIV